MLSHGFSGTESSWNGSCSAFGDWKQCIKDTLSGDQRNAGCVTLISRTRNTDWPFLCQFDFVSRSVRRFYNADGISYCVLSVRNNTFYNTIDVWWNHGFVNDRFCFRHFGDDRAWMNFLSLLDDDMGIPFFVDIERFYIDTTGNVFAGFLGNFFQWSLDTVKNVMDDTRSEHNGNGVTCGGNCFARFQSCCFFIYLNGGAVFAQRDDLSNQIFLTYIYHF